MKRRLILWLLFVVAVWLVVARYAQISKLTETLKSGDWGLVVAAGALQLAFYVLYTVIYHICFYLVGIKSRVRELLPIVFSSVFVNVAVPTGGASGLALFIDDSSRRGESPAKTAAGVLLVLTVDFSAFVILLGLGMAYLAVSGDLQTYVIAAAAVLIGIIASMAFSLLLGLWKPHVLLNLLQWVQRTVNRLGRLIKRPWLLPDDWAPNNAMEFVAASLAIAADPLRLGRAGFTSLTAHLVNAASLYVLFLAFYQPISLGVLVAGYAIGNLFWIVSIAPQGVGVVEGMMTLIFGSLGIPVSVSAVVVLAYRGLGFWLPLIAGFFTLRMLRTFRDTPTNEPAP